MFFETEGLICFDAVVLLEIDNRWTVPYNPFSPALSRPTPCRVCEFGEEHQVCPQMMPVALRPAALHRS